MFLANRRPSGAPLTFRFPREAAHAATQKVSGAASARRFTPTPPKTKGAAVTTWGIERNAIPDYAYLLPDVLLFRAALGAALDPTANNPLPTPGAYAPLHYASCGHRSLPLVPHLPPGTGVTPGASPRPLQQCATYPSWGLRVREVPLPKCPARAVGRSGRRHRAADRLEYELPRPQRFK